MKEKIVHDLTYGTGSNDSETRLEHLVCSLISLMERSEESRAMADENLAKAAAKKRVEQAYLVSNSQCGMERRTTSIADEINVNQMLAGGPDIVFDRTSDDDEDEMLGEPQSKRARSYMSSKKHDLEVILKTTGEKMAHEARAINVMERASATIAKYAEKQDGLLEEQKKTNQRLLAVLETQNIMQQQSLLLHTDLRGMIGNLNAFLEKANRQLPKCLLPYV
ncbi:hypothetical protein CLU79DRAFT_769807 [Phycomyces nitens]|nr:hypothetical protein CLU79DRAFT_769807 [Phycomyces nitens]